MRKIGSLFTPTSSSNSTSDSGNLSIPKGYTPKVVRRTKEEILADRRGHVEYLFK